MGFMDSVGNIAGFNNIKAPSKGEVQSNMMFSKDNVKSFGGKTHDKWSANMKDNPYGKKHEAEAYGQQKDAVNAQVESGVRSAREGSGKYGNQDIGRRQEDSIRRAGMGAQATARRSTAMDFLNNKVAFDQFLMNFGLSAGQVGQNAQSDAMWNRNNLKNENRTANSARMRQVEGSVGAMFGM